jgi:CheY-like chemotaxis protein
MTIYITLLGIGLEVVRVRMLNVLLVDDNPEILAMNRQILQYLGCRVTAYTDPLRALKLVQRHNPYDVIITDIKMPVMNGVDFFRAVKHLHPHAVIIFTSVSSSTEMHKVIRVKGVCDYLFGGCFTIGRFKKALDNAARLSA